MFISAHLICYCRHSHNNNSILGIGSYLLKMYIKVVKEKGYYKVLVHYMRKLHYHGSQMRKRSRPTYQSVFYLLIKVKLTSLLS